MKANLALVFVAAVLAGCASSQITVKVDLYKEDPRVRVPLLPEEVASLVGDIERLRAAAREKTAIREDLATVGVEYYLATWRDYTGKDEDKGGLKTKLGFYIDSARNGEIGLGETLDESLRVLKIYRDDYTRAYLAAQASFAACEANRMGKNYGGPVPSLNALPANSVDAPECQPPEQKFFRKKEQVLPRLGEEWIWRRMPPCLQESEARAREAVDIAAAAYRGFSGPVSVAPPKPRREPILAATDNDAVCTPVPALAAAAAAEPVSATSRPTTVSSTFILDWPGLRGLLSKTLETAQRSKLRDVQLRLEIATFNLNKRLEAYAEHASQVAKVSIEAQGITGRRLNTGLFDSVLAVAAELEGLRTSPPETESSRVAFANLVRNGAILNEVIDRTQDMGDAVLRHISAPENASKWSREHAKTYFYAQGNASVVIVRDNAGRYSLHEANNDPSALIKGQLEVSRAVANAAISIATAQTGLKVPRPSGKDDTSGGQVDDSTADALVKRKAKAEVDARNNEKAIAALQLQLGSVLTSISNANGNATVLANQKTRLQAILKAWRTQFAKSGG